jgi:hypothetical protein
MGMGTVVRGVTSQHPGLHIDRLLVSLTRCDRRTAPWSQPGGPGTIPVRREGPPRQHKAIARICLLLCVRPRPDWLHAGAQAASSLNVHFFIRWYGKTPLRAA